MKVKKINLFVFITLIAMVFVININDVMAATNNDLMTSLNGSYSFKTTNYNSGAFRVGVKGWSSATPYKGINSADNLNAYCVSMNHKIGFENDVSYTDRCVNAYIKNFTLGRSIISGYIVEVINDDDSIKASDAIMKFGNGNSTKNITTKNFTWTTDFNIAFNKNEVLELAENQTSLLTAATFDQDYNSQTSYIAKVGLPMGMMYGYVYEGTYKYDDFNKSGETYTLKNGIPHFSTENNTQPGMPKYKDLNGDGTIDSNDRTIIGRGLPIHTGGFTNNFTYKGFDLSIFFQWSYGNDIMNANRLFFESSNNRARELNQYASYADRWTPENPDSDIPAATTSSSNRVISSRIVEDGSFLRLKTLTLGYTFPKAMIAKAGLSNVRLYLAGQNLWTLTSYSGYDPEVSVRNSALTPGLDFSSYPRSYTISFGVNLGF